MVAVAQDLGESLTLGPLAAGLSSPLFGLAVSGPVASALRRMIYLFRLPTSRHRAKVAGSWASRASALFLGPKP